MPKFSKKISTDQRNFEFHFNRIYTVDGREYHVSVKDHYSSHHFLMNEGEGQWRISEATKTVEWIKDLEPELGKAILEHEKRE